jgi:hypothetical protein
MDAPPLVPGYSLLQLIGFGATGEVWLAREDATGDPVAVKVLSAAAADAAGVARMQREAAVLAAIEHPHLVRLRGVRVVEHSIALVLEHAAGGSLASLLARRGRLVPGEVVTLAVPLAEALQAVHARGVVHGDVTPSNVLLTAEGRPLLADLGVAAIVGEGAREALGTPGYVDPAVLAGGSASRAGDVYALAAVCFTALTGSPPDPRGARPVAELCPQVPEAMAAVLDAALDPLRERRPLPVELAAAMRAACPPVGLRLSHVLDGGCDLSIAALRTQQVRRDAAGEAAGGAGGARHRRDRRRPWLRLPAVVQRSRERETSTPRRWLALPGAVSWPTVALAVGVAVAGVGAVLGGVLWAQAGQRGADAGSAPAPAGSSAAAEAQAAAPAGDTVADHASEERWERVLEQLDATRSRALAEADPSLLHEVYAEGSTALRSEQETLRGLEARGLRVVGHDFELLSVQPRAQSADRVQLKVTDAVSPHRFVDVSGAVVEERSGRAGRTFDVTLARRGSRWLVYEVKASR